MNTGNKSKVKLATVIECDPKAPFSIATTPRCREWRNAFPWITLDPYIIMLSVKQGIINYHCLSLWYNSTWDWTQVYRAISELSNYYAKGNGKCHRIFIVSTVWRLVLFGFVLF